VRPNVTRVSFAASGGFTDRICGGRQTENGRVETDALESSPNWRFRDPYPTVTIGSYRSAP